MKKILSLLVVIVILSSCNTSDAKNKYDDLAMCLTSNNAELYGAFWCPHCQKQKKAFGKSFKHINYIECDPRDESGQPELCTEKDIQGFPTWILGDGTRLEGQVDLKELAEKTGCPYPEETNSN